MCQEAEVDVNSYPDDSLIFEGIYDEAVSSMAENLSPTLLEGSGSAQWKVDISSELMYELTSVDQPDDRGRK